MLAMSCMATADAKFQATAKSQLEAIYNAMKSMIFKHDEYEGHSVFENVDEEYGLATGSYQYCVPINSGSVACLPILAVAAVAAAASRRKLE